MKTMTAVAAPAIAVGSPSWISAAEDANSTQAVATIPTAAVFPAGVSIGTGTSLASG
jgi:hypothetical protein